MQTRLNRQLNNASCDQRVLERLEGEERIFLIITAVIALWLCLVLFSMKKSLEGIENMNDRTYE